MEIAQSQVNSIVARANELGASEGLTHKTGQFQLKGHAKPHNLAVLAFLLVDGWENKSDLDAALLAALEFVEKQASGPEHLRKLVFDLNAAFLSALELMAELEGLEHLIPSMARLCAK